MRRKTQGFISVAAVGQRSTIGIAAPGVAGEGGNRLVEHSRKVSGFRRPLHGFTLIELLVVIGIIGVLIALLLPALNRAQRSAAQQVCASNLRQIALAVNSYAAENNGFLVPGGAPTIANQTINGVVYNATLTWSYLQLTPVGGPASSATYTFADGYLGKYLQNVKVLTCPETQNLVFTVGLPPTEYALTQLIPDPASSSTNPGVIRLSQIGQASTTAAVGDAIGFSTHTGFSYPAELYPPSNFLPYGTFHGRHPNGIGNVGFYDGHVEAIQATQLPWNFYPTALTSANGPIVDSNHIGMLIPTPVNFTADGVSSNSSYVTECPIKYDYYFEAALNK